MLEIQTNFQCTFGASHHDFKMFQRENPMVNLKDFDWLTAGSITMAVTPFKAKAEERAKLAKKDDEKESPDRPGKRACNTYEKQLSKMPAGDLTTAKEFQDQKSYHIHSYPNPVFVIYIYNYIQYIHIIYIDVTIKIPREHSKDLVGSKSGSVGVCGLVPR